MKNLVLVGASVLLAVKGQIDGGECTYAVELLQLQDGSASFRAHIQSMAKFMAQLVDTLQDKYGEFKYGVSSFVDKPIPYSGYGAFGAWHDWVQDYCYRHHTPLAEDATTVVDGLNELVGNLGSGNDFPENPLEALMYAAADSEAQWSPPDQTHSPGGRPIVKIAMVITDDIPHSPVDAYSNTQLGWNWPREYPYGPAGHSTGGFGSHSFAGHAQLNLNGGNEALYYEMADLFSIIDNEGTLSAKQEARLDELIAFFGPYPWPAPEAEHPGDLSLGCAEVEYPTAEQVGAFLRPHNVLPIFLVARPQSVAKPLRDACNSLGFNPSTETTACLVEYYKHNVTQMGIPGVVAAIDGDNTLDVIVEAVGALTDLLCLTPTTTTTSTTTVPTTELVTTQPTVTTLSTEESTHSGTDADHVHGTKPDRTEGQVVTDDEQDQTTTGSDRETTSSLFEGGVEKTEGNSDASTHLNEEDSESDNDSGHNKTEEPSEVTRDVDQHSTTEQDGEKPSVSEPAVVNPATDEEEDSDAHSSLSTGSETSSTEEDLIVVIPPPPVQPPVEPPVTGGGSEGSDGPGAGVIAGAAGGAVAGVAALAGLAYAKFGAGMFGGGAPAGMEGIQQVEVPESPIERETMEEVTMDMFQ